MDRKSTKFDWNRLRAFLVTAEEGSLSAAARALNVSQPTLGRQVTALEDELNVALFERVGGRLVLTPTGFDLIEHARAMGNAATQLSLTASGQSQSLEGKVCISAGEIFAALALPPIIQKLRIQEPGIEIEIIASNHSSDLRRREADIAFRAQKPTQPDLIAKKVCDLPSNLYASSTYLEKLGAAPSKEELCNADFIDFDDNGAYRKFLKDQGLDLSQKNFPVTAESHLVQWELAKNHMGIITVLEKIGEAEPNMKRVLPSTKLIVSPMWLVTHRELKTSRRIRKVFDFLYQELKTFGEAS